MKKITSLLLLVAVIATASIIAPRSYAIYSSTTEGYWLDFVDNQEFVVVGPNGVGVPGSYFEHNALVLNFEEIFSSELNHFNISFIDAATDDLIVSYNTTNYYQSDYDFLDTFFALSLEYMGPTFEIIFHYYDIVGGRQDIQPGFFHDLTEYELIIIAFSSIENFEELIYNPNPWIDSDETEEEPDTQYYLNSTYETVKSGYFFNNQISVNFAAPNWTSTMNVDDLNHLYTYMANLFAQDDLDLNIWYTSLDLVIELDRSDINVAIRAENNALGGYYFIFHLYTSEMFSTYYMDFAFTEGDTSISFEGSDFDADAPTGQLNILKLGIGNPDDLEDRVQVITFSDYNHNIRSYYRNTWGTQYYFRYHIPHEQWLGEHLIYEALINLSAAISNNQFPSGQMPMISRIEVYLIPDDNPQNRFGNVMNIGAYTQYFSMTNMTGEWLWPSQQNSQFPEIDGEQSWTLDILVEFADTNYPGPAPQSIEMQVYSLEMHARVMSESPVILGPSYFEVSVDETPSLSFFLDQLSIAHESEELELSIVSSNYLEDTLGTFDVVVATVDSYGNQALYTITIHVFDDEAPELPSSADEIEVSYTQPYDIDEHVISIIENSTDNYYSFYELEHIIISDNYTGNETIPGNYQIDYEIYDPSGNASFYTLTIHVFDDVAPVIHGITILNKTINEVIALNQILVTQTALDDIDGNVTDSITIMSNEYTGNETIVGSYDVVIRAIDAAGNAIDKTITINVFDTDVSWWFPDDGPFIIPQGSALTQAQLEEMLLISGIIPEGASYEIIENGYEGNEATPGTYTIIILIDDDEVSYQMMVLNTNDNAFPHIPSNPGQVNINWWIWLIFGIVGVTGISIVVFVIVPKKK